MASIELIRQRIDEIDALLAAGVKSASVDDQRVDYDLTALKDERDRLARIVAQQTSSQYRRVVFKNG